ncbi:hypothetical protein Emag_006463 [Eimeria magna]
MVGSELLCVVVASLSFGSADGNDCFTTLSAAREEAGLSALTKDTTLFSVAGEATARGVSKAVCDTFLTVGPPLQIPLYLSAESSRAAVRKWQQGFKAFEDDPPVDKGVEYAEANSEQISFVTLYNPDSQAKGQCSVATCKVSRATRDHGEEKTVSGLVCSTIPKAFGSQSLLT